MAVQTCKGGFPMYTLFIKMNVAVTILERNCNLTSTTVVLAHH
jgi:hypothetical protein